MTNQKFTIAQSVHTGHPAPGGSGVHEYDDGNSIWQIQFHPEQFTVYRRWVESPPLEGEFSVVGLESAAEGNLKPIEDDHLSIVSQEEIA